MRRAAAAHGREAATLARFLISVPLPFHIRPASAAVATLLAAASVAQADPLVIGEEGAVRPTATFLQ